MPHFLSPHARRVSCFGLLLAAVFSGTMLAAQTAATPNMVCGPDVSAGAFRVAEIGPRIAGLYEGRAKGRVTATGVQTFPVQIEFSNVRLYMSGDGAKSEMRPVRGTRKALRYDVIKGRPLSQSAHATDLPLQDIEEMTDCDSNIAPQFEWTFGTGARSSGGILSFLGPDTAIGMTWNSATGVREVVLAREYVKTSH